MGRWWKWHESRLSEAREARERAEEQLRLTRAQTDAYIELAESLRKLRARNHFGDAIAQTFRGERPSDRDDYVEGESK